MNFDTLIGKVRGAHVSKAKQGINSHHFPWAGRCKAFPRRAGPIRCSGYLGRQTPSLPMSHLPPPFPECDAIWYGISNTANTCNQALQQLKPLGIARQAFHSKIKNIFLHFWGFMEINIGIMYYHRNMFPHFFTYNLSHIVYYFALMFCNNPALF